MAPSIATKRLRKELISLQVDPPPGIIAEPDESNILKWYYAIRGPIDTPYDGGIYIGKLVFPSEYPMKGPSILMLTPSGRFQPNTRLCMSMSDFHPESWNPMWSVATIIQGVQSFMASEELTTGGIKASEGERKKLAKQSIMYNNTMFPTLFNGNIETAMKLADEARIKSEAETVKASSATSSSKNGARARRNRRAAAAENADNKEEDDDKDDISTNNYDDEKDNNKDREELSPEEIEKRRKRNAKKRAKQKAKKAAEASANVISAEKELAELDIESRRIPTTGQSL